MSQVQQPTRLTQNQYNKALVFTFNYFDQDKDGYLNRKEFGSMLGSLRNKLNFSLTSQISDYTFNSIPKANPNLISVQELEREMGHFYYNVNL